MKTPWFLGNSHEWGYHTQWGVFGTFLPLIIWSAAWTGLALWHAAKREDKGWFVIFLFVHTAGILEILYLIFVAKAFATPKKTLKKRKRS
jgi:hypothetical protein